MAAVVVVDQEEEKKTAETMDEVGERGGRQRAGGRCAHKRWGRRRGAHHLRLQLVRLRRKRALFLSSRKHHWLLIFSLRRPLLPPSFCACFRARFRRRRGARLRRAPRKVARDFPHGDQTVGIGIDCVKDALRVMIGELLLCDATAAKRFTKFDGREALRLRPLRPGKQSHDACFAFRLQRDAQLACCDGGLARWPCAARTARA